MITMSKRGITMYDAHNDLLTNLYFNLKSKNRYQNLESLLLYLRGVYQTNNIHGGIINFLFTTPTEMYEKLGITQTELNDIKKMFQETITFLENLKFLEIIDENTEFLYSIEGCNYLNLEDLEALKQLGLAAIHLVSNGKNKYGSGYNEAKNEGLTEDGKILIREAINLKIMIDVSNCNETTFNDILDIIEQEKNQGKEVYLIASHTNAKDLCEHKRNFSKNQLERLRKNNAYIGINTNTNILTSKENPQQEEKEQALINQINYMLHEINFEEDKILIATDDMNYHPNTSYHKKELYPLRQINQNLTNLLTPEYGTLFTRKVLVKNQQNLFEKLKPYQKTLSKKII